MQPFDYTKAFRDLDNNARLQPRATYELGQAIREQLSKTKTAIGGIRAQVAEYLLSRVENNTANFVEYHLCGCLYLDGWLDRLRSLTPQQSYTKAVEIFRKSLELDKETNIEERRSLYFDVLYSAKMYRDCLSEATVYLDLHKKDMHSDAVLTCKTVLGKIYLQGHDTERNVEKGVNYLVEAALGGQPEAFEILACLYAGDALDHKVGFDKFDKEEFKQLFPRDMKRAIYFLAYNELDLQEEGTKFKKHEKLLALESSEFSGLLKDIRKKVKEAEESTECENAGGRSYSQDDDIAPSPVSDETTPLKSKSNVPDFSCVPTIANAYIVPMCVAELLPTDGEIYNATKRDQAADLGVSPDESLHEGYNPRCCSTV